MSRSLRVSEIRTLLSILGIQGQYNVGKGKIACLIFAGNGVGAGTANTSFTRSPRAQTRKSITHGRMHLLYIPTTDSESCFAPLKLSKMSHLGCCIH